MNIKPQNTDIVVLKNYIFDPLSTIIKLAVLKNKSIGTKISIKNNIIYIQESGIFQSFVRYYNGNSKNDLHFLSIPIEFACAKYINNEMISKIPDIMILFKCAQDGLLNLMETYNEYPIIVHCLKYYYSIIETHINEQICDMNCVLRQKTDKYPIIKVSSHIITILDKKIKSKSDKSKNKTISILNTKLNLPVDIDNHFSDKIDDKTNNNSDDKTNNNSDDKTDNNSDDKTNNNSDDKIEESIKETKVELIELYNEKLLNTFYSIWSDSKINIILGMIKYLLSEKSPVDYVRCIETFIIPIDSEIYNIIHNEM